MLVARPPELGPVDILVNNAGLLFPGALLDHQKHEFDQMWEVNVKGILHVSAAAAPSMIERKYGRIINLSSIRGARERPCPARRFTRPPRRRC